ncbi:hypothetical protein D3C81_1849070 [compost metagenome]
MTNGQRVGPAADALTCFQHFHLHALRLQLAGGCQTGKARADHQYLVRPGFQCKVGGSQPTVPGTMSHARVLRVDAFPRNGQSAVDRSGELGPVLGFAAG